MTYDFRRNVPKAKKNQLNTENIERKPRRWALKPLQTGWVWLGVLQDTFMIGMCIFLFDLFQTGELRGRVTGFQLGYVPELHVSELLWTGSGGDPKLGRFYCPEDEISCGIPVHATIQTS